MQAVWEYQRKHGEKWKPRMLAVDRARGKAHCVLLLCLDQQRGFCAAWTLVDNSAGFDVQELVTPPEGWVWNGDWQRPQPDATT